MAESGLWGAFLDAMLHYVAGYADDSTVSIHRSV